MNQENSPKTTVRRLCIEKPFSVSLHEETLATPADTQMLVRNRCSLISAGTELAMYTGTHAGIDRPENTWAKYPFYPGYASVGTIITKGAGTSGPDPGESVLHFQPHASHSILAPGRDLLFAVPRRLDDLPALLTRFCQISYTAVLLCRPAARSIAVLGGGLIGNLCAQLLQIETNASVALFDLVAGRVEIGRRCGLKTLRLTGRSDERETLRTAGVDGFDTVVEATGAPEAIVKALELVEERGHVVLLGSPRGKVILDPYRLIHRKLVTVSGAHELLIPGNGESGGPGTRESVVARVFDLMREERLVTDPLITHRIQPSAVPNAYDDLMNHKGSSMGVVILWTGEG